MTRIYSLGLILLTAICAKSQIVVTNSNIPGTGYVHNTFVGEDVLLDEGNAGSNQVWDFSSMTFESNQANNTYVLPANTGLSSKFPNSNLVSVDSTNQFSVGLSFLEVSEDEIFNNGAFIEASFFNAEVVYTDPQLYLKYPFTYGDSFEDVMIGTSSNTLTGIIGHRTGTYESEVDGYGKIILPNGDGEFDALRVKSVTYTRDSAFFSENDINIIISTITAYDYYLLGEKLHTFKVVYLDQDNNGIPQESKTVIYNRISDPVGLKQNESNVLLTSFPNPVKQGRSISFDLPTNENKTIESMLVTDQMGRVTDLSQLNVTTSGKTLKLETSNLNEGMYVIHFLLNGISYAENFQVI